MGGGMMGGMGGGMGGGMMGGMGGMMSMLRVHPFRSIPPTGLPVATLQSEPDPQAPGQSGFASRTLPEWSDPIPGQGTSRSASGTSAA